MLTPEEKAFHDALVSVRQAFGPFDQGTGSIWVEYEPASENEDASIGVMCGNCSFHYVDNNVVKCKLLSFEIEEGGKCRLAAIPDGLVNPNNDMEDNNMEEDTMEGPVNKADSVRVGQMVSWNSSGGRAEGKVIRVIRDGKYKVPNSSFTITGTPDAPAAVIRLYRNGKPTDTIVGHKVETLNKYDMWGNIFRPDLLIKDSSSNIPTDSMASNARRGLDLRDKYNRGGTSVGIARARDIANKKNLSDDTILRMHSFFSRHEVDKKGQGWNAGEDGYPSNGLIAWLLWGGDSGKSWAESKRNAIMRRRETKKIWKNTPFEV
jgi:hypothetical protein